MKHLSANNKASAYLMPAKTYKMMLEIIENIELLELATIRLKESNKSIRVNLEDL